MTMQDPHAAKFKKRHHRQLTKLTKPSLRPLKGVLSVLSVFRGGAFSKKRPFALCVKRMGATDDLGTITVGSSRGGASDSSIGFMANDDIVLTVSEREKRDGIFDCHIEGRYLLSSSVPLIDACRALLAQGYNPAASVVMRHAGSDDDALHGILSHVAGLQVGGDGVGFRPRPEPATASPVRFSGLAPITLVASC